MNLPSRSPQLTKPQGRYFQEAHATQIPGVSASLEQPSADFPCRHKGSVQFAPGSLRNVAQEPPAKPASSRSSGPSSPSLDVLSWASRFSVVDALAPANFRPQPRLGFGSPGCSADDMTLVGFVLVDSVNFGACICQKLGSPTSPIANSELCSSENEFWHL